MECRPQWESYFFAQEPHVVTFTAVSRSVV